MSPFSLICLGAAGLTHLVLGLRLLWLSRRTRGMPERLWGLTWFLGAVENFSESVGRGLSEGGLREALVWTVAISFPAVVIVIFFACLRLFRPGEWWARALTGAICVVMLGAFLFQVTGPGLEVPFGDSRRTLLNWAENLGLTSALLWASIETWRYNRMFTKRARLGLVPRMLGFRYLMWFGSAAALLVFYGVMWTHHFVGVPVWLFDISLPLLSLVSVSLMWITFFPPASLVERVERGDAP